MSNELKTIFLLFFCIALISPVKGQFWNKVGNELDFGAPEKGPYGAYGLYADTSQNRLFLFGQMQIFDTNTGNPIASHTFLELKNGVWDTIDKRNNPFIGVSIADVIYYKGAYYATGGFNELGSSNAYGWAKYENQKWDSLLIKPDNGGFCFSNIDDTLYIGGLFAYTNGIYSPGIVKFDGTNFYGMDPLRFDSAGMNAPRVYAIKKFKEYIVVGGTLNEFLDTLYHNDLVVYDKKGHKKNPPNWRIGIPSNVYDVEVFKGSLYVAGSFTEDDGVSLGNNIVRWDGDKWYRLGNGCNAQIYDLEVYNDELIVVGLFDSCDGVSAQYIIKWNGNQWCSFTDDYFNNTIRNVEIWKDTILIVGRFSNLGASNVNFLASWNGGDQIIKCGDYHQTAVESRDKWSIPKERVYPNPGNGQFTIRFNSNSTGTIHVYNCIGSVVHTEKVHSESQRVINLPNCLPNGMYYLEFISQNQRLTQKLILKR